MFIPTPTTVWEVTNFYANKSVKNRALNQIKEVGAAKDRECAEINRLNAYRNNPLSMTTYKELIKIIVALADTCYKVRQSELELRPQLKPEDKQVTVNVLTTNNLIGYTKKGIKGLWDYFHIPSTAINIFGLEAEEVGYDIVRALVRIGESEDIDKNRSIVSNDMSPVAAKRIANQAAAVDKEALEQKEASIGKRVENPEKEENKKKKRTKVDDSASASDGDDLAALRRKVKADKKKHQKTHSGQDSPTVSLEQSMALYFSDDRESKQAEKKKSDPSLVVWEILNNTAGHIDTTGTAMKTILADGGCTDPDGAVVLLSIRDSYRDVLAALRPVPAKRLKAIAETLGIAPSIGAKRRKNTNAPGTSSSSNNTMMYEQGCQQQQMYGGTHHSSTFNRHVMSGGYSVHILASSSDSDTP